MNLVYKTDSHLHSFIIFSRIPASFLAARCTSKFTSFSRIQFLYVNDVRFFVCLCSPPSLSSNTSALFSPRFSTLPNHWSSWPPCYQTEGCYFRSSCRTLWPTFPSSFRETICDHWLEWVCVYVLLLLVNATRNRNAINFRFSWRVRQVRVRHKKKGSCGSCVVISLITHFLIRFLRA